MGAIYNIYFECETSWQKPSCWTKQRSINPSLWQLSPPRQRTHSWSAQRRLEGAPRPAVRWPVPELTSLPRVPSSPLSLSSLGLLAPCSLLHLAGLCFLFHELLGWENLPLLLWQARGSLPFQSWKETQREH